MERQTWKGHWTSSDLTQTLHKHRNPETDSASFKINKQLSWKLATSSEPCTDVPAFLHFPGRRSPLGNGGIGPVPYRGDAGGRVLDMLSAQLAAHRVRGDSRASEGGGPRGRPPDILMHLQVTCLPPQKAAMFRKAKYVKRKYLAGERWLCFQSALVIPRSRHEKALFLNPQPC